MVYLFAYVLISISVLTVFGNNRSPTVSQSPKVKHKALYSHGYGISDSRYFRHGARHNEANGGTCSEFLTINGLGQCCAHRDDDCYMIHYDTRCYCDVFCDRHRVPDNSDCCPDAVETCSSDSRPTERKFNFSLNPLFNPLLD